MSNATVGRWIGQDLSLRTFLWLIIFTVNCRAVELRIAFVREMTWLGLSLADSLSEISAQIEFTQNCINLQRKRQRIDVAPLRDFNSKRNRRAINKWQFDIREKSFSRCVIESRCGVLEKIKSSIVNPVCVFFCVSHLTLRITNVDVGRLLLNW